MYPVEYKAIVWNEIECENEEVHGITFGETYTEALELIEKYYGDDIISIELIMHEEGEVFEFDNMILKAAE